ncbi:MAG: protoporphyrinogen oxidase [Desulfurivibrionaceae bacterium]|nr:protoporphyrinogen oxidase [Desulfurivibrionaceae bacterium]
MEKNFDVVIVGGGLTGLSAAHFLVKRDPGLKIGIVEKEARTGGAIQTFRRDGYQAEWGPHGFLNNTEESLALLRDLGLDREMQTAPLGDFRRFICFGGKLEPLPQSPKMLLSTPLLSLPGKLRLLADLWKKPRMEDQTIGAWAAYRFGAGVLPMVDVAVTGTFAGDLHRLSIDAVMPGVRRLEKEAGSLLRGVIKKKKTAPSGARGLPAMINFPAGMERFTDLLAAEGKGDLMLSTTVTELGRDDDGWLVGTDHDSLRAPRLVIALPVNASLRLLGKLDQPPVAEVPTARIANVVMGYGREARVPRGFGYLAPETEGRFALGAMFSSHMFPDRCPEGHVLLEALVGGRRHPERLELDDQEMISRVYDDISRLMPLPAPPVFTAVLRSAGAIPQLEMDHPALLEWRCAAEKKFSGLHVCGFGWDGIGMNDVIKSAARAAEALLAEKRPESGEAPVKPVYF